MNKLKAIIIDDSPQARKLLLLMLEEHTKDERKNVNNQKQKINFV
jgi:hypothetical protein